MLYGIGLGGFVDSIVLHQVLQWHHMVSDVDAYSVTTVAGSEANTLVDSFFYIRGFSCRPGGGPTGPADDISPGKSEFRAPWRRAPETAVGNGPLPIGYSSGNRQRGRRP